MVLKVADFFCGAGGFSEGFRQMGFKIVYGTDIWCPAVETFRKNFPEADVPDPIDVKEININDLPDVDVVIGGPPCTYFSSSNNGGKGDISSGMILVKRFLRIVEELSPKWWVMENIPRLKCTLPKRISHRELGIGNSVECMKIPQMGILNAADYGVPQARRRLFSGRYPNPPKTHSENGEDDLKRWKLMKDIVWGLPYPLRKSDMNKINDPLYPQITLDSGDFSDHRYDTFLTAMEVEEVMRSKTRHRYYGKMSFPDDLSRPSRTVMASLNRASRETMVIPENRGRTKGYRIPTVRECASLQSFPLTFQFWAPYVSQRYKLVGNAAPPILARGIARAILMAEGKSPPEEPIVRTKVKEIPDPLPVESTSWEGRGRKYPLHRYYCDFIGHRTNHSSIGCRIDIDNRGNHPKKHPIYGKKGIKHIVEWRCVLYTGYAKNVRERVITLNEAMSLICKNNPQEFNKKIIGIMEDIVYGLVYVIPDATTCQGIFSGRVDRIKEGPLWIRDMLTEVIDDAFPKKRKIEDNIDDYGNIPIRKEIEFAQRDAAKVIVTTLTATIMNESDVWLLENWGNHFKPDYWPEINKYDLPDGPDSIKKIKNVINERRMVCD